MRRECEHCGARLAPRARFCRECGSDAATGWQGGEEIDYQAVELPDGYAAQPGGTRRGRPIWVVITALFAAAALLAWAVLR
jgi:hypothetical protein